MQEATTNVTSQMTGSTPRQSEGPKVGPIAVLGWGLYLACSWTWVIGMFLPALLWRDFGVWSFVVFAVPNIVGAASLGYVMKRPEASVRLLAEHSWMVRVFSLVTVVYQVYFAAWIGSALASDSLRHSAGSTIGGWIWLVPGALCVIMLALPGRLESTKLGGVRFWLAVCGVVWVISVATIVRVTQAAGASSIESGGTTGGYLQMIAQSTGERPVLELLSLSVISLIGFAACPYLDATFHRARIESRGQSKAAFSIGFGWLFAIMIIGTLATAPVLVQLAKGSSSALLLTLFGWHTAMQLLLTVRLHAMEMPQWWRVVMAIAAAGTIALVLGIGRSDLAGVSYQGLSIFEIGYRCLLGAYGLLFPAYVFIVMWPMRMPDGSKAGITKARIAWFIVVVAAAMPFYWVAFMDRKTWWGLVGVAIIAAGVIGARASVRRAWSRGELTQGVHSA